MSICIYSMALLAVWQTILNNVHKIIIDSSVTAQCHLALLYVNELICIHAITVSLAYNMQSMPDRHIVTVDH